MTPEPGLQSGELQRVLAPYQVERHDEQSTAGVLALLTSTGLACVIAATTFLATITNRPSHFQPAWLIAVMPIPA